MTGTLLLSSLAGALSILSPCVLPLLPMLLLGSLQQHRLGPVALAAGLLLAFTTAGVLLASVGFAIGIGPGALRAVAAATMIGFGGILLVPRLRLAFAGSAAPIANGANDLVGRFSPSGLSGQFLIGTLLGAIWSPCSGPTLGAAIGLATRSGGVGPATAIMAAFGVGAVAPLLGLAYGSRQALMSRRNQLARLEQAAKPVIAVLLIAVGILVWSGLDKALESWLTGIMPLWLVSLTTRF